MKSKMLSQKIWLITVDSEFFKGVITFFSFVGSGWLDTFFLTETDPWMFWCFKTCKFEKTEEICKQAIFSHDNILLSQFWPLSLLYLNIALLLQLLFLFPGPLPTVPPSLSNSVSVEWQIKQQLLNERDLLTPPLLWAPSLIHKHYHITLSNLQSNGIKRRTNSTVLETHTLREFHSFSERQFLLLERSELGRLHGH